MFFFSFTFFSGCFIKFINRKYCETSENVSGKVSKMSANSYALAFCFTNLLTVMDDVWGYPWFDQYFQGRSFA